MERHSKWDAILAHCCSELGNQMNIFRFYRSILYIFRMGEDQIQLRGIGNHQRKMARQEGSANRIEKGN